MKKILIIIAFLLSGSLFAQSSYFDLPLTGIQQTKYKIMFDYKNGSGYPKIYYSFAGTTDSTNVTTDSWQTEIKVLKSNVTGNDTLKIWLDKQAKVKIDNVKLYK